MVDSRFIKSISERFDVEVVRHPNHLRRLRWRISCICAVLTILIVLSRMGVDIGPLLAGFGERIVREPLTQAERDVVYAMRNFERFRSGFSIRIVQKSILQFTINITVIPIAIKYL